MVHIMNRENFIVDGRYKPLQKCMSTMAQGSFYDSVFNPKIMTRFMVYSGARTPLGPSPSGRIIRVSSFQGLLK